MCLIPCCAGTAALGGWKVKRSLDKAFSSSSSGPQEKTESAIVTEAKLALKLASFKPGTSSAASAPPTQGPPSRSLSSKKKVSQKEQESKARLQELIDQYAPSKSGRK